MMRLMCGRVGTRCARCHPLFRPTTMPSALRRHSTTAADGAAKAKLTSPGAPLHHVLKPISTSVAALPSSVSPSAVVLHTSYAPLSAANAVGHDENRGGTADADDGYSRITHLTATPSYTVTNVAAFEQLISEALHLSEMTVEVAAPVAAQSSRLFSRVCATPASQGSADQEVPITLIADHTACELQILLTEAKRALAPSTARKAKIDRFVYGVYLPLLRYGAFTLCAAQLVVYFRWIFFVFDWNLVEPTTYFLAYTGVFASLVYHYYRCSGDGSTWKDVFQHLSNRKAEKTYAKEQLDVAAMAKLQRRIASIERELARMSV
ncbi:hypothetical protein, conserved [Leishmania tarentolae]|uniref:Calcium uniporter protein C-terminal domain-containing protein n=1 Tax=Leishmania tarentolae TaxID=5689 RepID=A0A640KB55_LEITA|nr:hypothetical protein, conserved [Leishmania tarentolae]